MVDRFEKFSAAISEISRYWHKITTDEMAKYDLKGTYAIYLTNILKNPNGVTAVKLCELCGRDKADVSRAISAMEKKGLIVKESVNNNTYRAAIKLTEEGRRAAEHVNERAMLAVEIAGGDLTEEKRIILYEALEMITAKLQQISEEGLPKQ